MSTLTNPFGLLAFLHWNHDWNKWHFSDDLVERALPQLQDLGVGFLRMDILWSDILIDGKLDFSKYDSLLKKVTGKGIHVLGQLQYNKIKDAPDGSPLWSTPPDSDEEFASYVEAAVRRYKGMIRHWEIWNEPNHPYYWTGPKDNLRRYCRLLKASYAAAKKADPSCLVMNGGLTEPIISDIDHLYANGGKNFTDILSIHTFLDPLTSESLQRFDHIIQGVQDIMKKYGDEKKKIWITEMGCPGVPSDQTPQKWWIGQSPTEDQQAMWLETQYALIKGYPSIEKLFWAFYRDTDAMFEDDTNYLGIVRSDLTPKPAFFKMRELIKSHRS